MHDPHDLPAVSSSGDGREVVGVEPQADSTAEPVADPTAGPAAPVSHRWFPETVGGVVYLVMLVAAVSAVLVVVLADWRTGVRIFAGVHVVAALFRLTLPERTAGMLAVRHRAIDVFVHLLVAGVMLFLAGSIPDQPL